jgi:hypothetical protein
MSDVPQNPPPAATPETPPSASPSAETLKAALKAFKKRLKLTQLDSDSRIGRSPMSSGSASRIAGITPPNQYPREVWEELVKQGKLKHAGHGMYAPVQ